MKTEAVAKHVKAVLGGLVGLVRKRWSETEKDAIEISVRLPFRLTNTSGTGKTGTLQQIQPRSIRQPTTRDTNLLEILDLLTCSEVFVLNRNDRFQDGLQDLSRRAVGIDRLNHRRIEKLE